MNTEVTNTQKTPVGIDVSKLTLDVELLAPNGKAKVRSFDNSPSGYRKLLGWA